MAQRATPQYATPPPPRIGFSPTHIHVDNSEEVISSAPWSGTEAVSPSAVFAESPNSSTQTFVPSNPGLAQDDVRQEMPRPKGCGAFAYYLASLLCLQPCSHRPPETPDEGKARLSRLTFGYFTSIVMFCYGHKDYKLLQQNLPLPRPSMMSDRNYRRVREYLSDPGCEDPNQRSVGTALFKTQALNFFMWAPVRWIGIGLAVAQVFCVRLLIEEVSNPNARPLVLYLVPLALAASALVMSASLHLNIVACTIAGLQQFGAVCRLVYEKVTLMRPADLSRISTGQITNLFSNDAFKLVEGNVLLQALFWAPVEIVIYTGLMWTYVGWPSVVSLVVPVGYLPIQEYIGRRIRTMRMGSLKCADERVKMTQEFLSAYQVLKMYSWESPISKRVNDLRTAELKPLRPGTSAVLLNLSLGYFISFVQAFVVFALYTLVAGKRMDAQTTFAVMTCVGHVQRVFGFVPRSWAMYSQMRVSLKRLDEYWKAPISSPTKVVRLQPTYDKKTPAIEVDGTGDFKWEVMPPKDVPVAGAGRDKTAPRPSDAKRFGFELRGFNIRIPTGQFLGVVGPVGSGKSSFINALLGEMPPMGDVSVTHRGTVAYVPQTAWIISGTVRQNIIMYRPFEHEWYEKVLHACHLGPDLHVWGGDLVEIGDRGVNVSGGQRQRIALARAVYHNPDIILLDDTLSALDAKVARWIVKHCLCGLLKHKTRILATHHIESLRSVDEIMVLNKHGERIYTGAVDGLENVRDDYAKVLVDWLHDNDEVHSGRAQPQHNNFNNNYTDPPLSGLIGAGEGRSLTVAEETKMGSAGLGMYRKYFLSSANPVLFVFLLFLFFGLQSWKNFGDYWISIWTEYRYDTPDTTYVWVLGMTVGIVLLLSIVRSMCFSILATSASTGLHNGMFRAILHAPCSFFEQNPIGRIMNRFAKDMDSIDDMLPKSSHDFFQVLLITLGSAVIIAIILPWFIIALVLIIALFLWVTQIFLHTSAAVKRLDSVSRTPIFSHFSSTLSGVSLLRAMRVEEKTTEEFSGRIDTWVRAHFAFHSLSRWFALRLDVVSALIVIVSAYMVALLRESLGPAQAGLVLTQSLQFTGLVQYAVRMFTETENYMTSVERISEYGRQGVEAQGGASPPDWPSNGEFMLRNLVCAYDTAPDKQVLKNISVQIPAKSKIGVVGRTGSGKSTMLLAFLRLLTVKPGMIFIDGVDISSVALSYLRQALGIIPQVPTLFTGSIRSNLDPFGEYSEDKLVDALKRANLWETVSKRGLDSHVGENGENFSVGQRQLLCMARALLRNSKVLLLDEATASVDAATDAQIQTTIREEFTDCTVFTIAHRINTVIDYDFVLVLNQGEMAEFGSPKDLLESGGMFAALAGQVLGGKGLERLQSMAGKDSFGLERIGSVVTGVPQHRPSLPVPPLPVMLRPPEDGKPTEELTDYQYLELYQKNMARQEASQQLQGNGSGGTVGVRGGLVTSQHVGSANPVAGFGIGTGATKPFPSAPSTPVLYHGISTYMPNGGSWAANIGNEQAAQPHMRDATGMPAEPGMIGGNSAWEDSMHPSSPSPVQ